MAGVLQEVGAGALVDGIAMEVDLLRGVLQEAGADGAAAILVQVVMEIGVALKGRVET